MTMKCLLYVGICLLLLGGRVHGQVGAGTGTVHVLRDVAYAGEHPAQRLDVYLPLTTGSTPVVVFIHGGGWRGGSKSHIPAFLASAVREGWLAVVSVEYRFTDVASHPAQVNDCLRAIRFVRHKAREWHMDPARIGVTGGSAGGHLSLWVALHDDAAAPGAEDSVARESSRVSCVVSFAGPTDWSLLANLEHKHPAYRQLLGYEPGTPAADMEAARKTSVSPITYVSADDPPVLLVHGSADDIVPIQHARNLYAHLQAAHVEAALFVVEGANHGVARAGDADAVLRARAFFRTHLGVPARSAAGAPPVAAP